MKVNFKCPIRQKDVKCNYCDSKGMLWGLKEDSAEIFCNLNQDVQCEVDSRYVAPSVGQRMSPDQVSLDRSKISKKHFAKEILPTIDKASAKWHNNKSK